LIKNYFIQKVTQLETIKINVLQESLASYEQAHEFKKLLIVANKLLSRDPNNAEYVLYKLKALDALGQVTKNIKLLQHYVNIRSTDITGFLLLYKAYMEVDNIAESIISLVFALSIDENDQECQELLLNLLKGIDPKYKTVKINVMTTSRVGHLACEIEPLLRFNQRNEDCLYIFISESLSVANTYLYDLLKSYSNIIENSFWFNFYKTRPMLLEQFFFAEYPYDINNMLRGKNPIEVNAEGSKNLIDIYQSYPPVVHIPLEDVDFGWSLLAELGIEKTDKIVCFHIRDSDYLSNKFPNNDFSYHDYRDAKIESYSLAIQYLIEQGYKVIRIGANSNQSLSSKNFTNYFDFCINRNEKYGDFLEIFLLSICDFFIATTSGPLSVAAIFDTPALTVNSVPFFPGFGRNSRFIPKRLLQNGLEVNMLDVCAGKTLSLLDTKPLIFTFDNEGLSENGYEYLDNSEDDIYDAVKDFSLQIKNRTLNNDLSELQKQYVKSLPDNCIFKRSKSVVSDSFLEKYTEIFK
jgi:putative glycosyltransferase (TIGR04372 family)